MAHARLAEGLPEVRRRSRVPPLEECEGQYAVYLFIRDFKVRNDGNGPSVSIIADGVNRSTSSVRTHLTKLMARGLVRRNDYDQLIIDGLYIPPDVG